MVQTRKQSAIFPDLPRSNRVVNEKGEMLPEWYLYHQQLNLALQTNFKPEGFVIPPKSDAEIVLLGNVSPAVGNILYDTDSNEFKGIVQVSSTPMSVTTVTKTFTLT